MTLRERIAYWVCPALKQEIEALRSGNTEVILENGRLLDKLAGRSVKYEDCLNCRCTEAECCP